MEESSHIPDNCHQWFQENGYVHERALADGSWVVGWKEPEDDQYALPGKKEMVTHYRMWNALEANQGISFQSYDNGEEVRVAISTPVGHYLSFADDLPDQLASWAQALNFALETVEANASGKQVSFEKTFGATLNLSPVSSAPFAERDNSYRGMIGYSLLESVLVARGYLPQSIPYSVNSINLVKGARGQ